MYDGAMKTALPAFVLAILLVAGFAARYFSMQEPIWLDECHTAWTVADDFESVAPRARLGNQPPLFFWLTWLAKDQCGHSVFSLRLVSLVASCLMMVGGAGWAWRVGSPAAACVFVGLVAFDGNFIFYGAEGRCYALVQFLSLLQGICFWRICRREFVGESPPWITWIAWGLLSVLMLGSHYMSGLLLAAELIFVAGCCCCRCCGNGMGTLVRLAGGLVAIGICLLPLVGGITEVANRKDNWRPVSSSFQLWIDYRPWLLCWMLLPLAAKLGSAFGLGSPVGVAGIAESGEAESHRQGNDRTLLIWLGVWAVTGPLALAVASRSGLAPVALARYAIVSWAAFALFASICVCRFRGSGAFCVAVLVIVSAFLGQDRNWMTRLINGRAMPAFRSEDWVMAAQHVASSPQNETVFLFADVVEDAAVSSNADEDFQQYLKFSLLGPMSLLPRDQRVDEAQLVVMSTRKPVFDQQQLEKVRREGGCAMVVRGSEGFARSFPVELEDALGQRGVYRVTHRRGFDNVWVIDVKLEEE